MADVPYLPVHDAVTPRGPAVGYAMVVAAAVLFGLNGTVAKIVLGTGLSSLRLTEARCAGAFAGLLAIVLLTQRHTLRVTRRELADLAVFGVVAVAFVQLFYFLAIHRLEIGVSLVIQYLGPVLVALWVRFARKQHVRPRLWAGLALALVGLSLVVDLWGGVPLDGLGVLFSLCSAVAFAAYLLLAEVAVSRRDTISVLCYGFLFATILWSVIQPWWTFPWHLPARITSLQGHLAHLHLPVWSLIGWIVVFGTVIPFFLIIGALRHLPATRVGVIAMLEPVVGALIAYAWLGETLGVQQLLGGAVVLVGIVLAQTAR